MNEVQLIEQLARGEDSRHQFKRDANNADGLTAMTLGQDWTPWLCGV